MLDIKDVCNLVGIQISTLNLNEKNYLLWERSVLVFFGVKWKRWLLLENQENHHSLMI